jgi:hypothetical protein
MGDWSFFRIIFFLIKFIKRSIKILLQRTVFLFREIGRILKEKKAAKRVFLWNNSFLLNSVLLDVKELRSAQKEIGNEITELKVVR